MYNREFVDWFSELIMLADKYITKSYSEKFHMIAIDEITDRGIYVETEFDSRCSCCSNERENIFISYEELEDVKNGE